MHKFCFVIHPLSLDDVARYEPGAKGKGAPIVRKIMEWMPPWTVVHVTGVRAPNGARNRRLVRLGAAAARADDGAAAR